MNQSAGLALIIIGGLMEGSFGVFMKRTPKWNWENIWGAGSMLALLLIPWPVALSTIPQLAEVYRSTPGNSLLLALVFGAGWGAGSVLFGLGLNAVGLSVGLSLIMGLIAVNGSLIPFLMQRSGEFGSRAGASLLGGIVIMVAGLVFCALAGKHKSEGPSAAGAGSADRRPSYLRGLVFCIGSGVLSALLNFALIYGTAVSEQAVLHGASVASSANAVWALVFTANYAVNVAYCVYLCWRGRSWQKFLAQGTGRYWIYAALMGALWVGGIVVYGMGANQAGRQGAYLGFPIMLISSILMGNILGYAGGEWKNSEARPRRLMAIGVGMLLLAIVVLSSANSRGA